MIFQGVFVSLNKDNSNQTSADDQSDSGDEHPPIQAGPEFRSIETPYLKQLKVTHRARARAAMRWRPRFLKALAMSCNITCALKAAGTHYNTFRGHQKNDTEFAGQVREAEEQGADLLHAHCFKSALEGNLEPVYFQEDIVGHIRKYDTRMQIEMLRAHRPDLFKTPGTGQTNIQINQDNQKLLVVTPEAAAELQRRRRDALRREYDRENGVAQP